MTNINRFEDIESWKRARVFTNHVYKVTSTGKFARDFALKDQLRRASVSILSNIAEGFERSGDKEFQQFLSLAKGSSGEARAQLYVALDQNYISADEFELLTQDATEISQLLSGFIKYLKSSDLKGSKFK
jgi:four helix bundle protein